MRKLYPIFLLFILPGCATLFEGSTQEIQVITTPAGVHCSFNRNGEVIARLDDTPGGVTIKKTKSDITILCSKAGYQQTTYLDHSGTDWVTAVDVLGGVLVGGATWGIDSASGSDNKYDSPVNITLNKK